MAERATDKSGAGGLPGAGREAVQLVVDYAKQETLGPLKALGRFLLAGMVGSVLLALGLSILLLGALRAMQTETGTTFAGSHSWMPYLATAAAAVVLGGLSAWRITKGAAARRRRRGD